MSEFDDADITQTERDRIINWLSDFDRLMDEACALLDDHPVYVKDGITLCSWCDRAEDADVHSVFCGSGRLKQDMEMHRKTARYSLDVAVHNRH